MILQRLAEYYDRKQAEGGAELPPAGFDRKEIPFVIVVDDEGAFAGLDDTRQGEGKKKRGRTFAVPQAQKRTVAVTANLLWDNAAYVLGVDTKGNAGRAAIQHAAFVAAVRAAAVASGDEGARAVLAFLERGDFAALFAHPVWPEVTGAENLSFRLRGDTGLVCQRPAVRALLAGREAEEQGSDGDVEVCLVTGRSARPARLHPSIKGVWGAQVAGANIVSFNLDAFNSHGRKQGFNAPVSEEATFAYTTALNWLLRPDSPQRMQVADASVVFWAQRQSAMETAITAFFSEPPKDDPDRNTVAVRALLAAPHTGSLTFEEEDENRFYVLGLAPNAARIAVRFWYPTTVSALVKRIRRHFEDVRIVRGPRDPEVLSIFRLLVSTAVLGKAENIRPNLAGATFLAILQGAPYPRELLAAAVQRCRAEREVTYPRAALIKACLNRSGSAESSPSSMEVSVSLDESNTNTGYRLGRLFSVLERAQEEASPGLNATIRDRYIGAASTTPVTVFPRLLKLSVHHLAKLDNRGRAVNLEKRIGEVVGGIDEFPALLTLPDQGRFYIGYYHQRQDFFKPRTDGETA